MQNIEKMAGLPGGYCNSLTQYSRFLTREVNIGNVPMGGHNPIRIQSMTTTDTMDTMATVEQTIRMVHSGCEYVRITAPSVKEAENLANIKKELRMRGYDVPLVADIHFTPNAAEAAARIVEKVRVNPGNYADKKKFENLVYTESTYQAELERIYKKFSPLVKICKEYGTAMRIGTNHGSLSDRIMSHYGDTPEGMVESAMEFIRICEDLKFYNLVISMKASNTQVMVQAYRLLVQTMVKEGMNYPLHLGVTEAGDGEDGRIKSAVGIGTLLADGLGDTVRVSLTEDPEFEAPVAKALVNRFEVGLQQAQTDNILSSNFRLQTSGYNPYHYQRRKTEEVVNFGGHQVPRVVIDLTGQNLKDPAILNGVGFSYSALLDKYNLSDQACDMVYLGDQLPSFSFPGGLKQLYNYQTWLNLSNKENTHPLLTLKEFKGAKQKDSKLNFVQVLAEELVVDEIKTLTNTVLILYTEQQNALQTLRKAFIDLCNAEIKIPVIIRRDFEQISDENLQLYSATDIGGLQVDGFGDGVWLNSKDTPLSVINSVSFGILQASRTRISKTEYISCPSCGRTLFDLQETTQAIRSRTSHLKGVKIGIMGCIVNGPGEMADADYGYVGAGPDRITLYRGQEVVKKNVKTAEAINELIEIIRTDGNWVEKED
ncbi:(E)-4-hydroxy-3-methylbut-2-enyl-diphosphate synthase [Pedobacter montanisoli]|uniref:4-hydroxy-3-methylbut-2-en-1-yl diphosphate synthase (flavodoxin) n=1 Tax=Pedobacter montanisoli TaxID=2923277 RepID=A0ABS9ZWU8_9SPHI|nr:(E)-4-hydroxy-3-methylbut-2-enyl-diphosphate synthase [Pedobacter montanisoli]MCJ0742774.1 (E)-4-hydroxy-3-methylbut-2-enyl-diphosphate synthase [Pedobacter montanisoli]